MAPRTRSIPRNAPQSKKRKSTDTEDAASNKNASLNKLKKSKVMANREERTDVRFWLMKAEPESRIVKGKDVKFSIDDLANMPDGTSTWDGVRNYEARNIMRDQMKVGDKVLFYHSNCKTPGVAGLAEVVKGSYPDESAFDPNHPYYDPKSDPASPRWYTVDVKFKSKFQRFIPLKELQKCEELREMALVKRGRLSVQPVRQEEFELICEMGKE
ncbi:uncharacterized protein VTP21DRAFT_2327 [Calcarisporiella thermophila]|uniref:uncharacterized protein n=1 Tax=Calcarisporiella thermophila TaxID=911321 RepID=UPI003742DA8B